MIDHRVMWKKYTNDVPYSWNVRWWKATLHIQLLLIGCRLIGTLYLQQVYHHSSPCTIHGWCGSLHELKSCRNFTAVALLQNKFFSIGHCGSFISKPRFLWHESRGRQIWDVWAFSVVFSSQFGAKRETKTKNDKKWPFKILSRNLSLTGGAPLSDLSNVDHVPDVNTSIDWTTKARKNISKLSTLPTT